jgi:hypothetical protein
MEKITETFKDRLLSEQLELDTKIDKLSKFIGTDAFYNLSEIQRSLLTIQRGAMNTYSRCLQARLDNLGT